MYGRNHTETTHKILSLQKSKNTIGVFDIHNKLVHVFNNNVAATKFLDCHKGTVGRYIKSAKLWANSYYIKIIEPKV